MSKQTNRNEYYLKNKEKILIRCKVYREKNRETINVRAKTFRVKHKEKLLIQHKAYREKNREKLNLSAIAYWAKNKEKFLTKRKTYYLKNRDSIAARHKKYAKDNKEKVRIYHNKYYHNKLKSNPLFRFNRNISIAICISLKGNKDGRHWENLVDYSLDTLRNYLQSLFKEGMTWENYGKWHLDHVEPLCSFNIVSAECEDFKKCWALSNLQPLWAEDNLHKIAFDKKKSIKICR